MKQIYAIASTTVGEAIRKKVLLIIMLIGVLFLVVAPSLGFLSARSETTVLRAMMLGVIQLTSAVIAIVLTVYMIPTEIERRTIYTILCKPVQRWQFLLGKYLGAISAMGIMLLLMTVVMLSVYIIQQGTGGVQKAAELAQAPLMFFVQMSLLAAVAVFFSTFVTPLVNFFLSGGIYLVGTLFAPFFESISKAQGANGISKGFAQLLVAILPNFAYYNVQNPIINSGQSLQNPTTHYILITAYGLIYITILIILANFMFDRREV